MSVCECIVFCVSVCVSVCICMCVCVDVMYMYMVVHVHKGCVWGNSMQVCVTDTKSLQQRSRGIEQADVLVIPEARNSRSNQRIIILHLGHIPIHTSLQTHNISYHSAVVQLCGLRE